jgi:hypothetical protein
LFCTYDGFGVAIPGFIKLFNSSAFYLSKELKAESATLDFAVDVLKVALISFS